ncbi:DUF802 domain-containing protein [Luteimonas aestuarii]|uniref:DUF802 domain-containing protein n=1 Tax=Luteimonas aestuarii TaxID=453837 RepID=A0A4R5TV51_9GAMM|nr:DUF802 domain-containing protein [Luteimonas aestuarii]TDK24957.1 DUF802 domain-containing protein [Luteimonas aestuarii]
MSRNLPFHVVFAVGLAVVCWIAIGFATTSPVAFVVTLVIAGGYLAGALELHRYRAATATLLQVVDNADAATNDLDGWLQRLDPGLRTATRQRIEGERAALPAPMLTPYLVGLLVLLGMLGTLLGMMLTLRGTGMALETATDLQAVRDSLAAPVKGLGFAFGASIAGVAASAMLGLLATLCRRERQTAVQRLDALAASALRPHTPAHQREQTLLLLQQQAELMPALVAQLQAMVSAVERQGEATHARLLAQQDAFHARTDHFHQQLGTTVADALRQGAADSARAAGAALQPVVASTMATLASEQSALHAHVSQSVDRQVAATTESLDTAVAALSARWQGAVDAQHASNATLAQDLQQALQAFADRFEQRSQALVDAVSARLDANVSSVADTWRDALAQQQAAHDAMAAQATQAVCATLETTANDIVAQSQSHAASTLAEIAGLAQAASEAPRVAAEVIGELRQALSDSMARDTAMLEERTRLVETLGTLLESVNLASTEQRAAVDALVATSGDMLERLGARFDAQVQAGTQALAQVSAEVAAGANEVASLGDAFGAAVQVFGDANQQLAERLQRVEAALDKSTARSDQQLAYYVAQAREVIDLSLLTQRQVIADLQRLHAQSSDDRAEAA